MKKILIATTALVATTAVASAAEMKISGFARTGAKYVEGAANEFGLNNRVQLTFDGITETDGGVKLEARIRMRATSGMASTAAGTFNQPRIGMSYAGFTTRFGNADGAVDNMAGFYGVYGVGYTAFLETLDASYNSFEYRGYSSNGGDTDAIYAEYAMDAFAIRASYNDPGAGNGANTYDISADYSAGAFTLGAGWSHSSKEDGYALAATYTGGAFAVGATYTQAQNDNTDWGLSASYAVSSALNIGGIYADGDSAADASYGIGADYGLGGGATIKGGVGSDEGTTTADFGVTFSF